MEEDKARVTKAVDELIEFGGGVIRCRKCNEELWNASKDSKASGRDAVYLHLKLTHNLVGNLLGIKS